MFSRMLEIFSSTILFSTDSGEESSTSCPVAVGVVLRLCECERLTEAEVLGLELSSSLLASGIAVDITSLRMLLYRQPPLEESLDPFPIFDGDPFPKFPWRIIRLVAKVFGDPERSKMFKLLLADVFVTGETGVGGVAIFDFFSSSTADNLLPDERLGFDPCARSSFLKSIRLVFGVPRRSEHVCGMSVLFEAQLCLPRGGCASSTFFGVDRPELTGEFPCERTPTCCSLNLYRSSSVSDLVGESDVSFGFDGVDVLKGAMFRGSIGEIFKLLSVSSFNSAPALLLAIGEKYVAKPVGVVFKAFDLILFGVEYSSSIGLAVCGMIFESSRMGGCSIGFGLRRGCSVQYMSLLRWNELALLPAWGP